MENRPFTLRQFFTSNAFKEATTFSRKWFYQGALLTLFAFTLILLQPFGLNEIATSPRIAYWLLISFTGYCLFSCVAIISRKTLDKINIKLPYLTLIAVHYLSLCLLMTLAVVLIGSLFFEIQASFSAKLATVFPQVLIINALLFIAVATIDYLHEHKRQLKFMSHPDTDGKQAIDSFLTHLPLKMRGELYCLEAQDHYVKVHTEKGRHLILMRLKDAISMLEKAQGLQVHRSWWISEGAVTEVLRDGRKIQLRLKNGVTVPVSRKWVASIKERNFL